MTTSISPHTLHNLKNRTVPWGETSHSCSPRQTGQCLYQPLSLSVRMPTSVSVYVRQSQSVPMCVSVWLHRLRHCGVLRTSTAFAGTHFEVTLAVHPLYFTILDLPSVLCMNVPQSWNIKWNHHLDWRAADTQYSFLNIFQDQNADKRGQAEGDNIQGELDGYIAADCPLCGYGMIYNIGLPLISDKDKEEMLTWQLWAHR